MDTRRVIALLLPSFLLGTAAAQGSGPSGCEMEISQKPGAAAAIEIVLRNVGGSTVGFARPHAGTDVVIVLASEAGNTLQHAPPVDGSFVKGQLKPGKSLSETVDLSKLFVLEPATRYSVVVTRYVRANGKWIQLRAEGSVRTPEKL
jgi:hypothetical protein